MQYKPYRKFMKFSPSSSSWNYIYLREEEPSARWGHEMDTFDSYGYTNYAEMSTFIHYDV